MDTSTLSRGRGSIAVPSIWRDRFVTGVITDVMSRTDESQDRLMA